MYESLFQQLDRAASAKRKAWWEAYLKGATAFRGVDMANIRGLVHRWREEYELANKPDHEQVDIALTLCRAKYSEDKMAGLLLLAEALLIEKRLNMTRDLPQFARLFADGHIADWNLCDWFCVKLLGPWIEREGMPLALELANWTKADVIWQRRAGLVCFEPLMNQKQNYIPYLALILVACERLVQDQARFAQTAVGWLLRELSANEMDKVKDFLDIHLALFSAESLRYVTAKMVPSEQRKWRQERVRLRPPNRRG